jgi:DNA polymerase-4
VSSRVFEILDEFSPLVEPLSVDEAFLDLGGTQRLLGSPDVVARRLKDRIKRQTGLTASVGVAPNKFLAKLASDLHKPDGLTVIRAEDVDRVLPPLPVSKLWGIGKVTASRLESFNIKTIRDLRRTPADCLQRFLGSETERYLRLSRGIDDRSVTPDRAARSIGHEQTFEIDVADVEQVRRVLMDQVEHVAARLRRHGLTARGVSLKIRFGDFQTITRSATLDSPTNTTSELWQASRRLLDAWQPFQPVRLIGMSAERLDEGHDQLPLFPDPRHEREQKLDQVADQINQRFGKRSIRRGGSQ